MVERLFAGRDSGTAGVLDGIRQSGAVERTRAHIGEYAKRAESALEELDEGTAKSELQRLARELVEETP